MKLYDDYLRWLYRGGRPNLFARLQNRASAIAFSAGIWPRRVATLEVQGRRTGRIISFPVVIADYEGERYLVAMLGANADWPNNVRAAGGHAVLRHGRRETVHLEDVPLADRPLVLRRYLAVAPGARPHLPVDRNASLEELAPVASQTPIFHITTEHAALPIGRDRSLNEVRAVIPADCYERPPGRAAATLAQAALLYVAPLVGLALTDAWWLVLPLWLLAGLGVAGLFVLGHDASHRALVASARANKLLARLCMVPSAHVEAAWDLGHNRIHHGYTTRQGFDFVWHPLGVDEYLGLGPLGRLAHRLEWSWAGAGAYFLRNVWWQKMMRFRPEGRRGRTIQADKARLLGAAAAALVGVGILGWFGAGPVGAVWLPVKLLVVPFVVFTQIIGWTVYVHHVSPDIRWWARREWDQFKGQMESTTILQVPTVVNRLWFHNIFVHVPHHVDPRIPFHQLPAAARAIAAAYPDTVKTSRFSLRGYLLATRRCKLYDFAAGRWLPYPTATRQLRVAA